MLFLLSVFVIGIRQCLLTVSINLDACSVRAKVNNSLFDTSPWNAIKTISIFKRTCENLELSSRALYSRIHSTNMTSVSSQIHQLAAAKFY